MSKEIKHKLTQEQIAAIERITNRGQRAEVVPVKDGLKILRVLRQEEKWHTGVVELEYTSDLRSDAARIAGSIPAASTNADMAQQADAASSNLAIL